MDDKRKATEELMRKHREKQELQRSYQPLRGHILTKIRERRLEIDRLKDDGCPN